MQVATALLTSYDNFKSQLEHKTSNPFEANETCCVIQTFTTHTEQGQEYNPTSLDPILI